MLRAKCKKCGGKEFWRVRRNKLKCKNCRYEFKYKLGNFNLTIREWKGLLKWFLRCQSINVIVEETKISEYKVLKSLKLIRQVMIKDVPDIFEGTVEVDETYLGGQKRNKRKAQILKEEFDDNQSKRGFGTNKQPVFAILARSGKVFARVVDDVEAKDLIPIIENKVRRGAEICSDTWRAYTGLATKGYVHRTVEHGEKEYVSANNKSNHINGLEGFFGYLKRQLASRGGIRRKRLSFYLAEYVWRYNNRELPVEKQIEKLLNLVAKI
jgi:transposase-like protein